MNIAYFLTPKGSVAYLYEDCTLRQGLEKLRHHGYSAIPVIRRDGSYVGVVREGDFLWQLMGSSGEEDISLRSLEQLQIRDIVHRDHPAVSITVSMEELLSSAATSITVPGSASEVSWPSTLFHTFSVFPFTKVYALGHGFKPLTRRSSSAAGFEKSINPICLVIMAA